MIDTHAHLDDDAFVEDRESVLTRAWTAGVEAVVSIGTGRDSSRNVVRMAEDHPKIFAVVGVHPTAAQELDDAVFDDLRQMARSSKVVGIGETGLDYYWKTCPPDVQQQAFRRLLRLAVEMNRPAIIHNRDAHDDVLRILEEEKARHDRLYGIMHCFSGDESQLRRSLALGFYISIAGNVTYRKSALPSLVPLIPDDRILAETDSPYLTPVPHRGKRNEPAHMLLTVTKLAECRNVSVDVMSRCIAENARRVYGLDM
jgi:TatD DNase family protein